MYIPTDSIPRPAAAVVARQLSGLIPPTESNGNPFHHDPTPGNALIPDSTAWYGAVWVVPVAWALTFYCVVSLLLLCTLYGQGVVDGKLNYIPHHLRQRRRAVSPGDAYVGRRYIPSVSVAQSDTATIIDYTVDVDGARDSLQRSSRRSSYLSNVGDRQARASMTSDFQDRAEHALFARYARRPEVMGDLQQQSVQRQVLAERLVGESEGESAERGLSASGEERAEFRQTRDLARRLEVARVESALAAAGVL